MTREPMDADRRRAELLALLGASPEGAGGEPADPDAARARGIEAAFAADPRLLSLLEDPDLDAVLRAEPVAPPSELEWARVDAAIAAATGGGAGAAARPAARPRGRIRSWTSWRALVPLAAAAILGAIVLREALFEGTAPAAQATIVEVDLPDDRPYVIVTEEGDEGGVLIFIASS